MARFWALIILLATMFGVLSSNANAAQASDCYQATVTGPTPFMGVHDEVITLDDGSLWQVQNENEYLYEYQPQVVICPSQNVLVIEGKSLIVAPVQAKRSSRSSAAAHKPSSAVTVVYHPAGCDYFIADGPRGYYLLEWYRGHDPAEGDVLVGYDGGYGFKDVAYPSIDRTGRIYAEDYLLSRDRVIEKLAEKCR